MTTIFPSSGFTANWTFDPPVSTPISLKILKDAFLINWYSLSVKVCAGAIVVESPVWMPIGSRFSIEQTIIQLSSQSLTTSISNSFQPIKDSSIKSSLVGDNSIPFSQIDLNSDML